MNLDFRRALDNVERAELIRRLAEFEPAYLFKHALVQETVYRALLKNERKRLHLSVAANLEQALPDQLDENAARLAEHFWLAEDWARAAEYSQRAGTNALRHFASLEALDHFERALGAIEKMSAPTPLQRYEALMGWAEAAAKYRPYAAQLEQLARAEKIARELDDKPRLARTLYSIGAAHTAQGHGMRAETALAECFTLADELGDERLTIIPAYFMGMATLPHNPRGAIPFFERAIELAQRYENQDMEAVSWSAKAWALAQVGEFADARAAIARGQALSARVKSPMVASDVDLFAGWAFLEMGDAEQGLHFGQSGLEKAAAAGNIDCVCGAHLCVGFNQLSAQRLPQAQTAFQEAIRESEYSGADVIQDIGRAGLALAQFYSGRSDSNAVLEQSYAQMQALDIAMSRVHIAQALSAIYLQRGDATRAEKLLTDARELFQRNQMLPSLALTLETLAQLYDQQGREEESRTARAEASHWEKVLARESESQSQRGARTF